MFYFPNPSTQQPLHLGGALSLLRVRCVGLYQLPSMAVIRTLQPR